MSHQPKVSSSNNKTKRIKESGSEESIQSITTYFDKVYSDDSLEAFNVYTWGSNEMGQLGQEIEDTTTKDKDGYSYSSVPIGLTCLKHLRICWVSAGDGHTVSVSKNGMVFSWGASACGQLGLERIENMPKDAEGYPYQPFPMQIKLLSNIKIKEISCGDAHSIALTGDGKLYSWGGAGCGQLGHPNINDMPKDSDGCPYQPFPKLVETFKNMVIETISCGKAHSIALDNIGSLFTWGAGACGQLGVEGIYFINKDIHTLPVDDDGYPYQPIPKYLKTLKGVKLRTGVCGDVHTLVLTDLGEVYSFGGGSFGQLGLGQINKMPLDSDNYPYMPVPTKMEVFQDIFITHIACGDSHSMAVDKEGRLYSWGAAACGQLGIDNLGQLPKDGEGNPYEPEPKFVTFFENIRVLNIACGETHSLVLVEGNVLYSFGGNGCGQLGYNDVKNLNINTKSLPKSMLNRVNETSNLIGRPRVVISLLGQNIVKISCGGVHNICLSQDEHYLSVVLYRHLKNSQFCDYEIFHENSINTNKIKCHKYVLLSRSTYFYKKLVTEKVNLRVKQEKVIIFKNIDYKILKSIIEYLYVDDINFIYELKSVDNVLELLKLAKLLDLKYLAKQTEIKLKQMLSKYYESLQSINYVLDDVPLINESDTFYDPNTNENYGNNGNTTQQSNEFKGLFFLPNGNPILILDEALNQEILKNSIIINYNEQRTNRNTFPKKNFQEPFKEGNAKTPKFLKNQQKNNALNNISNSTLNNELLNVNRLANDELITNIANDDNLNSSCISKANISSINNNTKVIVEKDINIIDEGKVSFNLNAFLNKYNLVNIENLINESDGLTSPDKQLGFDLLKQFNKPETSDVVLHIHNQSVFCSKIVLISRSKYFENMFSENLKENCDNRVNITDYGFDELILVLLFMYCDCLNLDLNLALDLLKGADRFAFESLKLKLENYISSKLEIKNAAKIYKYSSNYNCDKLKKISLYFINDFYKQIIETDEFEDLDREFMLEIVRFCKTK